MLKRAREKKRTAIKRTAISAAVLAEIDRSVDAYVRDLLRSLRKRGDHTRGRALRDPDRDEAWGWDVEDARQEAWILALEAAHHYRPGVASPRSMTGQTGYFAVVIRRALAKMTKVWESPVKLPRALVRDRSFEAPEALFSDSSATTRGSRNQSQNSGDRSRIETSKEAIAR